MTHEITITAAATLIKRFQDNKDAILNGEFSETDPFTISQTFKVSSVSAMLDQEGTEYMRAYFGLYDDSEHVPNDRKNKIVLVLCSVNEDNNDLNLEPTSTATGVIILEDAQLCPTVCGAPSKINNL